MLDYKFCSADVHLGSQSPMPQIQAVEKRRLDLNKQFIISGLHRISRCDGGIIFQKHGTERSLRLRWKTFAHDESDFPQPISGGRPIPRSSACELKSENLRRLA